jgi:hypothetical protein
MMSGDSTDTAAVIEVPWWLVPLLMPPLGFVLAGVLIPSGLGWRALVIVPSLLLAYTTIRVSVRTKSASMQSVWISLAYGLWVLFPTAWIVGLVTAH